jgi:HD-GYP domain-containing protein (c-di-GMP phosphodiesterase class II)
MSPSPLIQSETVLQPLGRALVTSVYATAKVMRFYPIENQTVQHAIDELDRVIRRVLEREGVIELRLVGDFLFLNDARLRLDLSDYASFSYVSGLCKRHGIGTVEIEVGFERQDIAPLLGLLLQEAADKDPDEAFKKFEERLQSSRARHVRVQYAKAAHRELDREQGDHAKQVAKMTYFQSVHVAKEVLTDVRLGRAVNLRRVKRAVQSIVDQVLNDESSILGMTTLRDYDEYTFTHCVNVCIFAVVLGQKLGLTKIQLYDLGLGALFHDIGKQRIPAEVTNKPGALTEDEWKMMQQHPTEGLLELFHMRGLSEVPYRAMLLAYEHHMKLDLTGYPRNRRTRTPRLFSRIVATVDGFDAATSRRSYQHQPWPPDEVIREMRDNPNRGFDPLLVKAFVNVTGIFPVGTLAILDTFELAVVTTKNPAGLHQPYVKIISDDLGLMVADPPTVDLSEIDPATGKPRRSIIKTVNAEKYGIRVSDYFV